MTIFLNIKVKNGKKAGNTGLTQANDAETTCNTAASDFCDEVTIDEGGRAQAACYDSQKYDSKKTPPCPLYTSVDYICNTAAWDYCKDDDAAPADCYDYQKYDSKKAPPCPVLPPKRD